MLRGSRGKRALLLGHKTRSAGKQPCCGFPGCRTQLRGGTGPASLSRHWPSTKLGPNARIARGVTPSWGPSTQPPARPSPTGPVATGPAAVTPREARGEGPGSLSARTLPLPASVPAGAPPHPSFCCSSCWNRSAEPAASTSPPAMARPPLREREDAPGHVGRRRAGAAAAAPPAQAPPSRAGAVAAGGLWGRVPVPPQRPAGRWCPAGRRSPTFVGAASAPPRSPVWILGHELDTKTVCGRCRWVRARP